MSAICSELQRGTGTSLFLFCLNKKHHADGGVGMRGLTLMGHRVYLVRPMYVHHAVDLGRSLHCSTKKKLDVDRRAVLSGLRQYDDT